MEIVLSASNNWKGTFEDLPKFEGARIIQYTVIENHVEGYDARIYMYESDMVYEFNVPMLMDRGLRCYCIYRQQISRDISFALKYAVTFYPDRAALGSGYDMIEGNIKHEVKAQLRLKF